MYYLDKNVADLFGIFDQNLRQDYIRMDLNENPGGLPEEFIQKVLSKVDPQFISQYPETLPFTETLADYLGVEVNQLCLTNGSAEAIRHIIEAYSGPGGRIVSVDPSYAMFDVYAKMYGRDHVKVAYNDDLTINIDNIIKEITPETQIVVVLNPNNPIGDVYSYEDMDRIIAAAKENEVTVLIDEAYHYFYPQTFLKYALENDNVFVTRTFSKLFSLAGCRLGYAVGRAKGIEMVQRLCTPHNVNAFSLLFAGEIIKEPGMIEGLVAKQLEGKKYMVDTLREAGYTVNAGEGNFVFIKPKHDADEIVKRMKAEKGILIKSYAGIGNLEKCLRVTTGETEIMKIFIDALCEVDQ